MNNKTNRMKPEASRERKVSMESSTSRHLSLVKGSERFVFRYPAGQEADVIDAFADLAGKPENAFDWFDAAVLSYQMGRRLEMELDKIAT